LAPLAVSVAAPGRGFSSTDPSHDWFDLPEEAVRGRVPLLSYLLEELAVVLGRCRHGRRTVQQVELGSEGLDLASVLLVDT
jgi:hypothetical protein